MQALVKSGPAAVLTFSVRKLCCLNDFEVADYHSGFAMMERPPFRHLPNNQP
jgi:hypothetical protein